MEKNFYLNGELYLCKTSVIKFLNEKNIYVSGNLPNYILDLFLKNNIFQLIIYNNSLNLFIDDINQLIKITEEELEKNFISLHSILKESNYIGQRAKMTKPISIGYGINDSTYVNKINPIILYKHPEFTIIYNDRLPINEFRISILPKVYGFNWFFYGEKYYIYNKKADLYKNIFKNILDNRQKKLDNNGKFK